ncbi:MAG: tRNA preQ1(34) S-adenosylmethionine ribosyltransferase-isomerase QueA [Gammaproteobacteria bacterium]|nr:tRNA preQ1(34) S-adenosylmethionine ribosyltransferase-isomerase QueA [Gammaproteobacteria bacterium]
MLTKSDFHYELPPQLIAHEPLDSRRASRLMVVHEHGVKHRQFPDVLEYLQPNDLVVLNDTKVLKARIRAAKDSGGNAEILIERVVSEHEALCQVRVSKALRPARELRIRDRVITVCSREGDFYRLRFDSPVLEFLEEFGAVPLPPYIRRHVLDSDEERYQTVYAQHPGSVAAPTAGLHFDHALLDAIVAKGVQIARLTLHVGAGTFLPVREEELSKHVMHLERYEIPQHTAQRLHNRSGRVVAVGTTVVRTLETWAETGELAGESELFITPGFKFQVVDALITNFHLPESTLLMLVSAFRGRERMFAAYREAVKMGYRFFSYGDAMYMERDGV